MIKIVKLTNGDELIGDLSIDQDIYNLDCAFVINSLDGNLSLVDYTSLSEETLLTFSQKHVICYYEPLKSLVDYYMLVNEYTIKYGKIRMSTMIDESVIKLKEAIELLETPTVQEPTSAFNTTKFRLQ